MHVIIAGGRDFEDADRLANVLDRLFSQNQPDSIICGMANGADKLGWEYARARGIAIQEFPADWDAHGKAAGPIRNRKMAEVATHLVAFWDGRSRGTKDMISVAEKAGLQFRIIRY